MDDLNIEFTKSLFEVFVDLTEISESISAFRKRILELLANKKQFPDLSQIINKTFTYQNYIASTNNLDHEIKNTINNFYSEFKKDLFSKYNIEDLEKFIKENFGFLFTSENFQLLRKYPQNKIKKILYEDNSFYTGQYSKNNYNKAIREGFGYFELFPSKDIYLGIFENDNFSKGVFIKNSNNFYIGNFSPLDAKFYKFEGMTISLSSTKLNISFGIIDVKTKTSRGDFFLIEDDKLEYFSGTLINDEKSCEAGLLISSLNTNSSTISELNYTVIKGEFANDIPTKSFEILKPEFHVTCIETEANTHKPLKGFVEFAKISRGVFSGEAEFDDYSFFPSSKGNILYENNTFYYGEFFSGKRSGKGVYFAFKTESKYLITDGNFQEDQLSNGKIYNDFEKFKQDLNNEKSKENQNEKETENETEKDGLLVNRFVFDGSFENNQFKKGMLLYDNGDKYVGEFLENKRHGEGVYYYTNGSYYKGEWRKNMKHGKGKYYDKNNDMFVQGVWDNNKIDNLFHSKEE